MADFEEKYKQLDILHQEALTGYNDIYAIAVEILDCVRKGLDSNELSSRLKIKDEKAEEMLSTAGKISDYRQDIINAGGDMKVLKASVDKFNEKLKPIMAKIIRLDNTIGEELKRTGIRISNKNLK
jgi:hypothetical protein